MSDPADQVDESTGQITTASDLRLYATTGWSGSGSRLSYTLNATTTQTMSLQIDCHDYAAYGELILTASGSGRISNTVIIEIPKDDNDNNIADGWRNDGTKNYLQGDDIDQGINSNIGDNITVLNEYRGLNVNGTWTDTDPNSWDLFIQSNVGTGGASVLPMTIHDMSATEVSWDSGRVYPFEIGGSNVYAVRLTDDSTILANCVYSAGTALGEMGVGPPSSFTKGCIYRDRISKHATNWNIVADIVGITDSVIAHEIGHGVHLAHCPDFDNPDCYMWEVADGVSQHVTQFASHHDQDYALASAISDRQVPAAGLRPYRRHDSSSGFYTFRREDVNWDGVINVLDLNYIVAHFESTDPSTTADVNKDGIVNILDLLVVAAAF